MNRRLLGLVALVLGLGVQTATPPTAIADGLPIPTEVGAGGLSAPGGAVHFVTRRARGGTVVSAIPRAGGAPVRSGHLHGKFVVPAVALDGSASGLSADGGTLVLIRPRTTFPRARTPLAILDAQSLRLRAVVTLRGDFSFDAISPDGASLFLIHYQSKTDPTRYEVRSYDVSARRLRPGAIVDPHERGGDMRGYPVTRAYSPDARWAYTLYSSDAGHSFVHALDTARGRAVCIDTPQLDNGRAWDVHLTVGAGGRTLSMVGNRGPVAVVDTRSFRVSTPTRGRRAAVQAPRGDGGDTRALPFLGVAALLLAGVALGLNLRRRRRLAAAA